MNGRLLYIDASQGASGDMILGALVDLGAPLSRIRTALGTLPFDGYTIRSRRLERCALVGRKVDVRVRADEHGRGWKALRRIVSGGALEPAVRDRALSIFRRLIEAEAEVHGRPADKIHLHEAGGTDAIVDIVGASLALSHVRPERIVVSPVTTGFGEIRCAHGVYPVPAPATALLVRGVPARAGTIEAERLTPTGAAILAEIADAWGPMPLLRPEKIGYGAGTRDLGDSPNMLRMILGSTAAAPDDAASATSGGVVVLECNVDDCTPQSLAHASMLLLEAGALDVFTSPVVMKKGRAAHQLTVLARPDRAEALSRIMLAETSTLGLRYRRESRIELERSVERVPTDYGPVRVKVGHLSDDEVHAWPEYDDCAAAARRHAVPLATVQRAALNAHAAKGSKHPKGRPAKRRSRR